MKLSVLYGCDNGYAPYTGVAMTSLLENNRNLEDLTIYLASMNIAQENLQKFQHLVATYGRKFVVLDTQKAEQKIRAYNCQGWNESLATWLRFFVLDQIPPEEDRILWLDSDTVVQQSLRPLAALPLEGVPLAAVGDSLSYYCRFRLGFGYDDPYFNAGVLLFNLDLWRREHILDDMMHHLEQNIVRYELNDQDLLNDYFRGRILKLPQKYNVQGFLAGYRPRDYYRVYPWTVPAYYTPEHTRQALADPVIIHFFRYLGDYPWTAGDNRHPYKALYREWCSRSLWKDVPPAPRRRELSFRIEKVLYQWLPRRAFLTVFRLYINRHLPHKPF